MNLGLGLLELFGIAVEFLCAEGLQEVIDRQVGNCCRQGNRVQIHASDVREIESLRFISNSGEHFSIFDSRHNGFDSCSVPEAQCVCRRGCRSGQKEESE